MSTVDATASSYVPNLNALQLSEQKLLRLRVSTCSGHFFTYEIIEESQKVFTHREVEISNLNNLCSIHCRALKSGTHQQELEPILLNNFQQKVQNLFHALLLGVFFCCCTFVLFLGSTN